MRLRDAFLLIAIAFIWGFNFIVIRWGLDELPPLLFSALRFLVCALPIVLGVPRPPISWGSLLLLGCTLGLCVFGFLYLGINAGLSAGLASVVMQAQVFFTLMFGYLINKEHPTLRHIGAMILAASGLFVIFLVNGTHAPASGFLLVLLGAFFWGMSNTLMKRLPSINMAQLMIWISLVPPLPLLILAYWFERGSMSIAALETIGCQGWLAVAYTSIFSTIVAYAVWGTMLQRYKASQAAPFALLVPVFGMASAWMFLGASFEVIDLIGPVLILSGLMLNFLPMSRNSTQAINGRRKPI